MVLASKAWTRFVLPDLPLEVLDADEPGVTKFRLVVDQDLIEYLQRYLEENGRPRRHGNKKGTPCVSIGWKTDCKRPNDSE